MKLLNFPLPRTNNYWIYTLLGLVVFEIFLIPFFPPPWHRTMYVILYTFIYLVATVTATKNRKWFLWLAIATLVLQWFSIILNLTFLIWISSIMNMIFFTLIVVDIIRQLVSASNVSVRIILVSIIGYLLVGLMFSMIILLVMTVDPGAFSFSSARIPAAEGTTGLSEYIYFCFITLCTVGYGDVIPLEPYSRSLTTMICVTGQLYIAVIIAVLIGKFASQTRQSGK